MIHLFQQAAEVQQFLEAREWRFCFIGGIALQHWGEPRATRDLDISLFTGFGGELAAIEALLGAFRGRIADARAFALDHRVLLLSTSGGIDIDVVLSALPFESDVIDRAVSVNYAVGVSLRIASAEDLFVLKAFADRAQDRADLIGIARRRGRQLDWDAILERLGPLVEVKRDPSIMERVQQLRVEARQ